MRLKVTCRGCHRNIEIEGDSIPSAMDCPDCGRALDIPGNILDVDQELGGFRVVRHIGSGSMGDVYECIQISMDRPVALKVLDPSLTRNPKDVRDFFREVRTLGRLDHPNIVTAFDSGEDHGQYYLAMALVEGRDLDEIVEYDGPLSEEEALHVGIKVAEALDYAWREHGIAHRDIKPSNVMLHRGSDPKLLDMGICLGQTADLRTTTDGLMVGTPHYMSPEQARGQRDVDFHTDIYALGCTLFHALTAKVPYDGPSVMDILDLHRKSPIPRISDIRRDISKPCVDLIRQMMSKLPEQRGDSWAHVIADLRRVQKGRAPRGAAAAAIPHSAAQTKRGMGVVVRRKLTGEELNRLAQYRRAVSPPRSLASSLLSFVVFVTVVLVVLMMILNWLPRIVDRIAKPAAATQILAPRARLLPPPAEEPAPPGPRPTPTPTPTPAPTAYTALPNLGTGNYTIIVWIRTRKDGVVFAKVPFQEWGEQSKALVIRQGRAAFDIGWVGSQQGRRQVVDGKWHQLAFCGADPQELYLDGELEISCRMKILPDPNGTVFRIGDSAQNFQERYFVGDLDEMRFYARRLSLDEIRSLRSDPKQMIKEGIVAYWPFTSNTRDVSGNKLHGRYGSQPLPQFTAGVYGDALHLENDFRLFVSSRQED